MERKISNLVQGRKTEWEKMMVNKGSKKGKKRYKKGWQECWNTSKNIQNYLNKW